MSANKAGRKDNETRAKARDSRSVGEQARSFRAGAIGGGPGTGGEGQSERVPRQRRGGAARSTDSLESPNTDLVPLSDPALGAPAPSPDIPLSHYKGTALKNIGRDPSGRVIPHKRSEVTARKVAIWVAGGYNKNDISVFLNVRPGLVEQCYGIELNHGADRVGMQMTQHIVARAKKSDRMAMFYAKARMGWREGDTATPTDVSPLNIHLHL